MSAESTAVLEDSVKTSTLTNGESNSGLDNASSSHEETFSSYNIDSHKPLEGLKRSKCSKCGGSRMYFCYKCHCYVDGIDTSKMPKISLPWKIDIIKHAKEVDGKSTAIHAALLAPDDVKIYTYPAIPDYSKNSRILLVFPDKKASTMEEVFGTITSKVGEKRLALEHDGEAPSKMLRVETGDDSERLSKTVKDENSNADLESLTVTSRPNKSRLDKVVFIDCTWSQAYSISTDERISHLATVKLSDLKTVYWRHNQGMPYTFLATIEAIYSFLKTSHELVHGSYEGQFDNMLYFYSYFHKLVKRGAEKGGMAKPQKN